MQHLFFYDNWYYQLKILWQEHLESAEFFATPKRPQNGEAMEKIFEFVLALLPIIWLIIALTAIKIPGFKACVIALAIAYVLSVFVWKMPLIDSLGAVAEGAALALWPIIIVIIAAVFTYNVCVATGKMEVIKKMLANVTQDKRVLVLIIAWGFGGFMKEWRALEQRLLFRPVC